jgi:aldehyde dehydrogenase (NAD+)
MRDRTDFYIGGAWVTPHSGDTIPVINPATEEVIARVPDGVPSDAADAAKAARTAFPAWAGTEPEERAGYLIRLCDALEARSQEIMRLITAELGMPKSLMPRVQITNPLVEARCHAEFARSFTWQETVANSVVLHTPVGVVAAITPWNFPLGQIMRKIAPALAAGCTVVLKPSEVTPLTAYLVAEAIDEIGLPAGTFNLITGPGPTLGEALVIDPEVDMVSLTGSTRAGRRVAELAGRGIKRVALELGGKSPVVALDDADLKSVANAAIASVATNSGQVCAALTRLLVPAEKVREAEMYAVEAARTYVVGDPESPDVNIGPLVSGTQRQTVLGYIQKGVDEGARLVLDGREESARHERGYYVGPTVFSDVKPGMTIEREEIFGPVLSIIGYESEADAVAIANGTQYGLSGAVWSADAGRAQRFAQRLESGQVSINGGGFNPAAPFGGVKRSGVGRENGRYGFEEFLVTKSLQF